MQPTPTPTSPTERQALNDYMMTERQTLIMRLAKVDGYLLAAGLIVEPTVKPRQQRRAERHATISQSKEGS